MSKKPTLIIMAAGMGSRFGGNKQIAPVDDAGHIIIDFSIYDALRAGFGKVVCVIKPEMEADFRRAIGDNIARHVELKYAYQVLDAIPAGFSVPEGRTKPWGTGHATLCALKEVDGPFAVINADDFYGPSAYKALYDFLAADRPANEHAMIAYLLRNTVTENGHVARGICQVKDGILTDVVERTHIEKRGEDGAYTEDGVHYVPLSGDVPVSMNCWAFGHAMMDELEGEFPAWLDEALRTNPQKAEYFLPFVANDAIKAGRATVRVLPCREQWYGMTYKEDMQSVKDALARMRAEGVYPDILLD